MATTKINITEVMNSSALASSAQNMISGIAADISTTTWKIDSQILNRNGIGVRLGNVQRQVSQIANSIATIRQAVESGAMLYDATETQVVNMAKNLGEVHSKSTKGANYSVYEAYFEQGKPDEVGKKTQVELSDEQMEQIVEAIMQENLQMVLAALQINVEMTSQRMEAMKESWSILLSDFKDNIKSGLRDEIITRAFQASSSFSSSLAGFINTMTASAKGPVGDTSFIIVNPNVTSTTGAFAKAGTTLGTIATGCKYGLPIIGGVLDYWKMVNDGEETGDALNKAIAHVGIGLAGGKAGAAIGAGIGSIFPVVGTAGGAVIGFGIGVVLTTAGNALFDVVYDNREEIKETMLDVADAAKEEFKQVGKNIGEVGAWLREEGVFSNCKISDWNLLGSILT